MRKVDDGEKRKKKRKEKKRKKEKNVVFSGHYVIARSLPRNDDRWNDASSCKLGDIIQRPEKKTASGASGTCRHFVSNPAILRTFWSIYPICLNEDWGRGVKDGELRLDLEDVWGRRMENSKLRVEGFQLRMDNKYLRIPSNYANIFSGHPLSRITLFWWHY